MDEWALETQTRDNLRAVGTSCYLSNTSSTVKCQTQDQSLVCGAAPFARLTGLDIWDCSTGPSANQGSGFRNALIPTLCAAVHTAKPQPNAARLADGGLMPGCCRDHVL